MMRSKAATRAAPIPKRIPPLRWRQPVFIWTPVALLLALGWPAFMLGGEGGIGQMALVAGAIAFAAGLVSLGAAWLLGRAPRTRRELMMHLIWAGFIAASAAPFALARLLQTIATAAGAANAQEIPLSVSAAMLPLALIIGLPIALFAAFVFALVATVKPERPRADDEGFDALTPETFEIKARARDVQPFY